MQIKKSHTWNKLHNGLSLASHSITMLCNTHTDHIDGATNGSTLKFWKEKIKLCRQNKKEKKQFLSFYNGSKYTYKNRKKLWCYPYSLMMKIYVGVLKKKGWTSKTGSIWMQWTMPHFATVMFISRRHTTDRPVGFSYCHLPFTMIAYCISIWTANNGTSQCRQQRDVRCNTRFDGTKTFYPHLANIDAEDSDWIVDTG